MVATFLSSWAHVRRPRSDGWSIGALVLCFLLVGPVLALVLTATGSSDGLWGHLLDTVLFRYIGNTLGLMLGVGILACFFGVTTAWVVTRYEFPGRMVFEWMLLLPAAIPAYIVAYTYTDFFEYAGPVQSQLRMMFGWARPSDYWFPEIRSLEGATLMIGLVLYPYVYLLGRAAFLEQSPSLFAVSRSLGHSALSTFFRVVLPIARPLGFWVGAGFAGGLSGLYRCLFLYRFF